MKIQLVANLSANGQVILSEKSNNYNPPEKIAGMAFSKAAECGNIILGSITYKKYAEVIKNVLPSIEVVVISKENIADVKTVKGPEDAIKYLKDKSFEKACVVGGTKTFNAFLGSGLADELFFNLCPIIINGGGILETVSGKVLEYKLIDTKSYEGIAMLHFVKDN